MISIIAAHGNNLEIGQGGQMPWPFLAPDMSRFRLTTLHKTVIMGSRTFKSLNSRPLPQRENIVVTRNPKKYNRLEHLTFVSDPQEVFDEFVDSNEELMVLGGAQLYQAALPFASTLYITKIYKDYPQADTFFPKYNEQDYEFVEAGHSQLDLTSNLTYQFFKFLK